MVRHDDLLEKTIAAHEGLVFARMGDGITAGFATASDAVSAAATRPTRAVPLTEAMRLISDG